VYVWYRDDYGNTSSVTADSIVLDTTAPTNGTVTATGATGAVALSWTNFRDTGSGIASYIVAQAAGGSDAAGNLVCLCARCHDDHHGGRLDIRGWEETSAGRRLVFVRGAGSVSTEVTAWIREQHALKIPVATIQRMARQIHGVEVTAKEVRAVH
jgi:hypothetical protein